MSIQRKETVPLCHAQGLSLPLKNSIRYPRRQVAGQMVGQRQRPDACVFLWLRRRNRRRPAKDRKNVRETGGRKEHLHTAKKQIWKTQEDTRRGIPSLKQIPVGVMPGHGQKKNSRGQSVTFHRTKVAMPGRARGLRRLTEETCRWETEGVQVGVMRRIPPQYW